MFTTLIGNPEKKKSKRKVRQRKIARERDARMKERLELNLCEHHDVNEVVHGGELGVTGHRQGGEAQVPHLGRLSVTWADHLSP